MADSGKTQIDLQKNKQITSSKRLQGRKSSPFISKKTILVGTLSLLILILLGRSILLGTQGDSLTNQKRSGLQNELAGGSPDAALPLDQTKIPSISGSSNDLFFGPVSLKNSSYIRDQLDNFAAEQATSSSQTEDPTQLPSSSSTFSFQEILAHPLDFLSSLGYSVRASVLNDGRKTTLLKLIDSLSRYYVSFGKFPESESSIEDVEYNYDWISEMVSAREMSGVYEYVLKTTSPVTRCGTVLQTGYCYRTNGENAILYVKLEEPSDQDICVDDGLFLLWSTQDNKLGLLCMDHEPTQLGGFVFLPIR